MTLYKAGGDEDELPVINIDSIGSTVDEFKGWPIYIWNKDKPGMEWLRDL